MHGGEYGALSSVLNGQFLVGTQTLLEVVAILVTVVQGVELAATRGPIKRLKRHDQYRLNNVRYRWKMDDKLTRCMSLCHRR